MGKKSTKLLLMLLMILPMSLMAQVIISGTVVDVNKSPLAGVSVQLKNSNVGTTTDASGRFSISAPDKNGVLVISYIGFQSQNVNVKDVSGELPITLIENDSKLQEVVVTGIATSVKRSNLANAVASVSSKELVGTTVQPTMDAALYGKFTGANISANSGAPGGGISIKLRGITSLVSNSQPLFIVDGVYYDNSSIAGGLNTVSKAAGQGSNSNQDNPSNRIADLDPEDIDRIEILKGASAAAIYGSRAAGGVVIISTKRGRAGAPKVELSHSIGFQQQLKKLGMRQWDETKVIAAYGNDVTPGSPLSIFRAANGRTFNYEDELYGNKGLMNNSRVSVSGGNEATKYYLGFTRKDDEGIVKNTGYRKNSFRLNVDQKLTRFLDISANANYVNSKADRGFFNNDNTSTTLGVSFVSTPSWVNLFPDANGNYPNNPLAPSNFLQTRDLITNRENVERILLGGTATLKLLNTGKQDLKVIVRGGLDQYGLYTTALFPRELQFQKDGNGTNGVSVYGTTNSKGSNLAAFLVHTFNVSDGFSLRTQLGSTAENLNQNTVLNTATQLVGRQSNLDQASAIQVDQTRNIQKDRGFFAQEEVNFNDLVLGTIGLRADKSSRNGFANKLYYYPKGSLAFNIHELNSWSVSQINQLKVRAAYGQSGNFAPFGATFLSLGPALYNGGAGSLVSLIRGNPSIEPERQKEFETGFDISVLKNRVGLEFTYYNKKVEDLILNVDVPTSSGYSQAWKNVADIENKGLEIALNATPVVTDNFRWQQTTSFWRNRAKVTRLDVPDYNMGAFGATLGTYRVEVGKSPTQIVGIGGPDDNVDPKTGLAVYGNGEPDFNLSSSHTLNYKRLEFSFLWHWKKGGENINLTTLLSDIFGTSPDFDKKSMDPTGQLTNGNYRLAALGSTARPWVQDASYLRLREIGLRYGLPKSLFKNIADIRLGLSARNLINIFDYNSYDPEVSNFGSGAISSNVEVTPYPSSKSFHFTISATF